MAYPDSKETPRAVTASTNIGVEYLQETERKIHAIGDEIVDVRARGFAGCWVKADPDAAALAAGAVVAMKATPGPGGVQYMVLATAAALAAGAMVLGVLMTTTAPGANGLVATGGLIPPDGLGLGAGSASQVRANAITGLLERASYTTNGDAVVGECTALGAVMLRPPSRFAPMRLSSNKLGAAGWIAEFSVASAAGGVETIGLVPAASLVGTTPAILMVEADFLCLTDDYADSWTSKVFRSYRWTGAALVATTAALVGVEMDEGCGGSGSLDKTATEIKAFITSTIGWRWFAALRISYMKGA